MKIIKEPMCPQCGLVVSIWYVYNIQVHERLEVWYCDNCSLELHETMVISEWRKLTGNIEPKKGKFVFKQKGKKLGII